MTHRNPNVFMGGELRPAEYARLVTTRGNIQVGSGRRALETAMPARQTAFALRSSLDVDEVGARKPAAMRPSVGPLQELRRIRSTAMRSASPSSRPSAASPGSGHPTSCRDRSRRACRPPARATPPCRRQAVRPLRVDGLLVRAHRRHRVGHQEDAARLALGAQRDADGRWMHVVAVRDQAAPQARRNRARAPTVPGARWVSGDMALNKCVTPRAPASTAAPGSDRTWRWNDRG